MFAGSTNIILTHTSTNSTWSSATAAVASVGATSGLVTSGIQGTTNITYDNGCGTAVSTVTVNATPAANAGNAQMCAGGTNITLTNTSTNGTWSSNAPTVAS